MSVEHAEQAKARGLGLLLLGAGVLAAGCGATGFWLGRVELDSLPVARPALTLLFAFTLTVAFTLLNVGLRWMRWCLLTRRAGAHMTSRDSLLVYTATLPAILTPFYLGEIVRPFLVARRYPRLRGRQGGRRVDQAVGPRTGLAEPPGPLRPK